MYVMCSTEYSIQETKQNIKTANGKKSTTQPMNRQVTKANQQDGEQNKALIGQVLHQAVSKHDPVHTSQNHKSIAQKQSRTVEG